MGPTHDDERESAARVDCDAPGLVEPGADAGAVAVASRAIESRAATSEGGDHPGGEVDTADAVAGRVLRCIMGNTDRTAKPMTRCGGVGMRRGLDVGLKPSAGEAAPKQAQTCRSGRSRRHAVN